MQLLFRFRNIFISLFFFILVVFFASNSLADEDTIESTERLKECSIYIRHHLFLIKTGADNSHQLTFISFLSFEQNGSSNLFDHHSDFLRIARLIDIRQSTVTLWQNV